MLKMFRTTIAAMAALVAVLVAAPAFADSGTGTITGQVVNKTPGGSPLGALQVTLTTYNNATAGSKQQATTDGAGKFQFDGLPLDPATTYTVTTRLQDVEYAWASEKTDRVALTATAPSANIELAVYDTTTSSSSIQVSNGHFLVQDAAGALQIIEVWRFNNAGTKTFVATGTPPVTLQFTLPTGASSVSPGGGFLPVSIPGGIGATMPVPPGFTDISFGYEIPYQGSSLTLTRKADYAIANFSLLIADTGLKVSSMALAGGQTLDMGTGTKYLSFTATGLTPGADIDASFGGLGNGAAAPSGRAGLTSTFTAWLVAAVLGVALIVALIYPRLRRKQALALRDAGTQPLRPPGPAGEEAVPGDEKALLQEIVRLDDDWEAGRIGEQEYRTSRARAKARIFEIYALRKEGGQS